MYRGKIGTPKTEAGKRNPVLPSDVVGRLAKHAGDADSWMLPAETGRPHATGALNKPLARVLKRCGIAKRVTTHGLRRTLDSLAVSVAPGELVRKVLGHTDAAMTRRYLAPATAEVAAMVEAVAAKVAAAKGEFRCELHIDRPPPSPPPTASLLN